MKGLMMHYPLTLTHFLQRATHLFGKKEIATKTASGMHRYTYAAFYVRTLQLMNALKRLGVRRGERVATFAWNHYRHLELYFAAPCMGAVLHTLNIRLPGDQLAYIINHAGDKVIFADASLLPVLEAIGPKIRRVKKFVVMQEAGTNSLPPSQLKPLHDFEELLARERPEFSFPRIDEHEAAQMCYTSGTTGNPKGVVYSHRALFLHSMAGAMTDVLASSENDVSLAIVPMFHANAWGFPYTCTMVGAKQVFTGPFLSPRDVLELIQNERVTIAAGVPTIWIGAAQLLEKEFFDVSSLKTILVGGAAMPRTLIEKYQRQFGLRVLHAWGMTETAPLGTVSRLKSYMRDWPEEKQFAVRAKQGYAAAGLEIRAADQKGKIVPHDGKRLGELQIRGPWVMNGYYHDPRSRQALTRDGWFRTGDVVSIDAEGYIHIADRTKDLVKSGGEWISSVDLENLLMAHPKVLEAAVIAVPHEKWQERPLACVALRPEHRPSPVSIASLQTQVEEVASEISAADPWVLLKKELLDFLAQRFPTWWLPNDIVFIDAVPKTSVGKFDKKVLREQFKEYTLPM